MVAPDGKTFVLKNACKPFLKEIFNDTKIRVDRKCLTFEFKGTLMQI